VVTATAPQGPQIGSETLTAAAMRAFARVTLDDAVNLLPGVTGGNSGGTRNERLIFVRGFDRFQVPLSIDGIRVYLPADNRLDFGRFLTTDIAQVQVAKGYASVLNGPGAMGGAINLVTSRPTRAFEGRPVASSTLATRANMAAIRSMPGWGRRTRNGMRKPPSRAISPITGIWRAAIAPSPDRPSPTRAFSRSGDWRVNAKIGFTPNATDEYSINYTRQEGDKNAPLPVTSLASSQRYWTWPYWNIDSLYFLSTTALGDKATFKTRAYLNSFDNLLSSWDGITQTTQTRGYAFNSYYADKAWGGSGELDVALTPADKLSLALFYRRDRHIEWQQGFPSGATEPQQVTSEDTWSLALENHLSITPAVELTLGGSYDWRNLIKAQDYANGALINYPLRNDGALNGQAQLVWTVDRATRVHGSVSSRVRFPTLFERFSTQFGTAASNPTLKAERATNVDLGASHDFGAVNVEGAAFYSHVADAIVAVQPEGFTGTTMQRQNLGDGDYYGLELNVSAKLLPSLELGGNYTWTHRDFTITAAEATTRVPNFMLTGVPEHKGFAYLRWTPLAGLDVMPNIAVASSQWSPLVTSQNTYVRTGSYVLGNISVDYTVRKGLQLGLGVRNLFDDNYSLADGYPEPGRSFFLKGRVSF
jgi:iron complex outermembrane receptor protein